MPRFTDEELKKKVHEGFIVESEEEMTPGYKKALITQLTVQGDTAGLRVGSPVRAFRQVELGLYPWNGGWWLGRRERGTAWVPLIGPLMSPQDSGLVLTYLDQDGNVATQPGDVALVDVLLRATRDARGSRIDSLRTRVALRG